jgi:hypothetical protein
MINLPPKPGNSTIEVRNDFKSVTLSWKNSMGVFGRYATLLFLIAWMGGWVVGEISAATEVLSGRGGGFLIFWLVGWSVGGLFCGTLIFKLARPSRPERIVLDTLYLLHEPGTEKIAPASNPDDSWNPLEMLKPRKSHKIAKKEVDNIRIDRVGERQRLSFDYGAKRIEIGKYLEEPEREWLFAVLKAWKSS